MTAGTFYAELGVELPAWSKTEAPVRCFAQPDAHRRGDRSPSCSVNLKSGAWKCHGCGACGGAYDAAIVVGHSPRFAIDLMILHGLAERRGAGQPRRSKHERRQSQAPTPPQDARRLSLEGNNQDVRAWTEDLDADNRLVRWLILERGWAPTTLRRLEIGFDGRRITIPIRNARGQLRGLLRYDPFGRRQPKMLAVPGTRLGLVPHPSTYGRAPVILVEGPPDMIAARSAGLTAIAVPGTEAWRPEWAQLLGGRRVTIVMDCDQAGRRAAAAISADLAQTAARVELVDLAPGRDDGYDLTDRLLERRRAAHGRRSTRSASSLLRPASNRSRQEAAG